MATHTDTYLHIPLTDASKNVQKAFERLLQHLLLDKFSFLVDICRDEGKYCENSVYLSCNKTFKDCPLQNKHMSNSLNIFSLITTNALRKVRFTIKNHIYNLFLMKKSSLPFSKWGIFYWYLHFLELARLPQHLLWCNNSVSHTKWILWEKNLPR